MHLFTRILFAASLTFMVFSAVTYTACRRDKCGGLTCMNGGACYNGVCTCPTGFTGLHCETPADPCSNIVCVNGGSCDNGICSCPTGYEGLHCDTMSRDKFLGVWNVFESGTMTGQPANYTVTISAGPGIYDVKITNLYNMFTDPISATVKGDSIVIPSQSQLGRKVRGVGYIDPYKHFTERGKLAVYYAVTIDSSGKIDDYGYFPAFGGSASLWNK